MWSMAENKHSYDDGRVEFDNENPDHLMSIGKVPQFGKVSLLKEFHGHH